MYTLWQDIRFGFRMMLRAPGFTLVAVLTLALGIGANTAIFSMVNAAMIRPLPFPASDRILSLYHSYPKINLPKASVSPLGYGYYLEHAKSFESIAAFTGWRTPQNLTGAGDPENVRSIRTSWNLFDLLRAQPMLGRTFTKSDDHPGARVAVLSFALWQRRFGSDRGILNHDIALDGANYTVIGVMPKSFDFPDKADLYIPLGLTPEQWNDGTEFMDAIGRVKDGYTVGQAQAELTRISADIRKQFPELEEAGWSVLAVPLRDDTVGDMRVALYVLLAAVFSVLIIGCANLANLLLARATVRQKEIAIRSAMGAGRWRMMRQLLTEGILLALLGGGFGLLLGYWGLDFILKTLPMDVPSFIHISVDRNVMLFTLIVAIFTGIAFSLIPAIHISHGGLNDALKEGGRVIAGGGRNRARASIVVSELAVALVLLISAGLLIKSFMRLQSNYPGFNPQNVITMRLSLPKAKYQDNSQVFSFFRQALERIGTAPGIKSVALATSLPLTSGWQNSFAVEGKPIRPFPHAHGTVIAGAYFPTMQIPMVRGRQFTEDDKAGSKPVVIVDANLVRAYFGNEDPIGKRIALTSEGTEKNPVWREIVGVVGSVKHMNPLEVETKGQFYLPLEQSVQRDITIAARTESNPLSAVPAIRREILAIDPEEPVSRVQTMEDALSQFVSQPRFNMILLGGFAGLALVLATIGVYGVMAYSVTQRTHEIGVRMALGAQRSDVLRMVLSNAMTIAATGLAIGLIASLLASRVLSTLLFGVRPDDPLTFIGISALLAVIAAVASYLPAYRATRIDPLAALRYE